jgi:hypothetical protein
VAHERIKHTGAIARGSSPTSALDEPSIHSLDLQRKSPAALACSVGSLTFTTQTCTRVLYRLLASPEYIEPLRREVEAVIAEEGWTKAGMDKMHKIDSFLRETQRFDALGIGSSGLLFLPWRTRR